MATSKRNLSPSVQSTQKVTEARQHLLRKLRSMVGTLNSEIFRLETIGEVSGGEIEKSYEGLAWAIDGLWEEEEMVRLESEISAWDVVAAKRGSVRGFAGGVAQ